MNPLETMPSDELNPTCTLNSAFSKCLIILYAPPALEESLVDWLLENEHISGFSTTESYGHGQRSSTLSIVEQVTGRQKKIQFIIEIKVALSADLLKSIGLKFPKLHYMITPLLEAGSL